MELNKKKILEYQQNRDPYLLIDHATEVVPGKSVPSNVRSSWTG